MTTRISRDEVGLLIAQAWSLRGTCARRQVGCMLVDRDGWPLSSGYNGPAAGVPHCIDQHCPGANSPSGAGLDLCIAIHAEQNALIRCRDPQAIHTCYVTASPCMHCVKMLLNTPCRRIVFNEEYSHSAAGPLWLSKGRDWVYLPAITKYTEVK